MGIAVLVFIGVFAIVAVPLVAAAPSNNSKHALAALDAVLKTEPSQIVRQQNLSVRKDEQLSSIPWLNKKLLKLDIGRSLRNMVSQAGLDWSAGRLLIMSVAGVALPPYILYMVFQSFPLALLSAVVFGGLPFGIVSFKRSRRFESVARGAGPDGERTARRPQPAGSHRLGVQRVPGTGEERVQNLL
jgi:tight adherence protein B